MKGEFQESTPFRFSETQPVVDYFGQQLLKAGYAYYGSEPMYSGIAGTEVRVSAGPPPICSLPVAPGLTRVFLWSDAFLSPPPSPSPPPPPPILPCGSCTRTFS